MKFDQLRSAVVPLLVDHIDTDQIIPARFLRTVNREGMAEQLFADWRKQADFPLLNPKYAGRSILIAGQNFGCGSSREHAPWALLAGGFRAIIASSFADIFRNNALRNGLLPIQLSPADYAATVSQIASDDRLEMEIDLPSQQVRTPSSVMGFDIDTFSKDCLLRGVDRIEYLVAEIPAIKEYEARRDA